MCSEYEFHDDSSHNSWHIALLYIGCLHRLSIYISISIGKSDPVFTWYRTEICGFTQVINFTLKFESLLSNHFLIVLFRTSSISFSLCCWDCYPFSCTSVFSASCDYEGVVAGTIAAYMITGNLIYLIWHILHHFTFVCPSLSASSTINSTRCMSAMGT